MYRKFLAEVIGTAALVFFGVGVAITNAWGAGYVGIAFAFGLVVMAMAYSVGSVSGGHFNPAVSLGAALAGRISWGEFFEYVFAQVVGALIGASLLYFILGTGGGFGTNSYGSATRFINLNTGQAFLVETVLTFAFVLAVLGVTARKKNGLVAGLVIGLSLTLVHLMGIPLTGTSVNPARSLAPALFTGGVALHQLWLFIVAPLVGAALAALVWRVLGDHTKTGAGAKRGRPALAPIPGELEEYWAPEEV